MHRIKEIDVDVPVPTTSLSSYFFGCHLLISVQYKLIRTRPRAMNTQSAIFLFLKENVCSYSLETALSSVNDSFIPLAN